MKVWALYSTGDSHDDVTLIKVTADQDEAIEWDEVNWHHVEETTLTVQKGTES